jgi:hypothetical protein
MTFCVVSAADALYFECLQGLLESVKPLAAAVVVVDLGLRAEQRARLDADGISVMTFSYPLDYPARRQVETAFPGFGAMLCRPYLNELVRGYDVLIWLDADAWAQQPVAVLELVDEARRHGMAAVPEVDRGYFKFTEGQHVWDLESDGMRRLFGAEIASRMRHVPVINSGVWAARTDVPLWSAWRRHLQDGLVRIDVIDDSNRTVEQGAFNVAIRLQGLPVRRFPATYNWLACLALPGWHADRGALVDPNPPHDTIRILHISTHLIGKSVVLPAIGGPTSRVGPVMLTRQAIGAFKAGVAHRAP